MFIAEQSRVGLQALLDPGLKQWSSQSPGDMFGALPTSEPIRVAVVELRAEWLRAGLHWVGFHPNLWDKNGGKLLTKGLLLDITELVFIRNCSLNSTRQALLYVRHLRYPT